MAEPVAGMGAGFGVVDTGGGLTTGGAVVGGVTSVVVAVVTGAVVLSAGLGYPVGGNDNGGTPEGNVSAAGVCGCGVVVVVSGLSRTTGPLTADDMAALRGGGHGDRGRHGGTGGDDAQRSH